MSDRRVVFDASALMALLNAEPGGDVADGLVGEAAISSVNWCEAYGKLRARGVEAAPLTVDMAETGIVVLEFDETDARHAGELVMATRSAGLSLADRACLALAARLGVPAVTADRAWIDLDLSVEVICIR